MKKLLIGVLIGLFIGITSTVGASVLKEYIIKEANYPIEVNQVLYESESLPILNMEGHTYVPLRVISDLLGTKVSWNNNKVEINEIYNYIIVDHTYSQDKKEFIRQSNLIHKYINDKDKAGFQSMFHDDSPQKISWTEGKVVISLTNPRIKEMNENEAVFLVDQTFRDLDDNQKGIYKWTEAEFTFVKQNNEWKIVGFNN
ncbi:stalk domain-containing protein [Chengkuizengella marina]|uniref:Copper amine oxidase-like N-terminal domain-containing protein n=1 Tax=Chengkuizengella marina TaxID=2507566 RepID=A0A6N9PY92_9BACL|nr:stalk domain-containing protein [Chengkuizengella marina]NBI27937.1 hypothetical protein [Chengkuizengella marina]